MIPLLVCILSSGGPAGTDRAAASARAFGLPVHIGLTEPGAQPPSGDETESVVIKWRDDFAAARNALARRAKARYLLWLDSDETLAAFPDTDWRAQRAPWLARIMRLGPSCASSATIGRYTGSTPSTKSLYSARASGH